MTSTGMTARLRSSAWLAGDDEVALNAAGGSTNAVIHLSALAGRTGVAFKIEDIASIGRSVPVLADVEPSGSHLMADFDAAGGVPAPPVTPDSVLVLTGCGTSFGTSHRALVAARKTPATSSSRQEGP